MSQPQTQYQSDNYFWLRSEKTAKFLTRLKIASLSSSLAPFMNLTLKLTHGCTFVCVFSRLWICWRWVTQTSAGAFIILLGWKRFLRAHTHQAWPVVGVQEDRSQPTVAAQTPSHTQQSAIFRPGHALESTHLAAGVQCRLLASRLKFKSPEEGMRLVRFVTLYRAGYEFSLCNCAHLCIGRLSFHVAMVMSAIAKTDKYFVPIVDLWHRERTARFMCSQGF